VRCVPAARAFVKAFFQFWYDVVIGDDWKIAAAVVTILLAGPIAVVAGAAGTALLAPLLAIGLGATFTAELLIDKPRAGADVSRRHRRTVLS